MKTKLGFALFASVMAMATIGCSKNSESSGDVKTATVKAEANGDWTKYSVEGVTISAPKEWKGSALDAASIGKMEGVLKSGNQSDQKLLAQLKMAASQGMTKLMVINPVPKGGFGENLNLVVESLPSPMDASQYAQAAAGQIKTMSKPGTEPKIGSYSTPAGDAGVITSTIQVPGQGGARMDVASTAYVLVKDSKAYVFTFSCSPTEAEAEKPTFEKIIKTVTLP